MTSRARGTFDVKLAPLADDSTPPFLGRMSLDKQFHGDLEATSLGQMLAAGTGVKDSAGYVAIEKVSGALHGRTGTFLLQHKDSAGYVAIEKVSGALHGRTGTFLLQHNGVMTRGVGELIVTVIPDSATEELAGLAGRMTITITAGRHDYEFEYTLAAT